MKDTIKVVVKVLIPIALAVLVVTTYNSDDRKNTASDRPTVPDGDRAERIPNAPLPSTVKTESRKVRSRRSSVPKTISRSRIRSTSRDLDSRTESPDYSRPATRGPDFQQIYEEQLEVAREKMGEVLDVSDRNQRNRLLREFAITLATENPELVETLIHEIPNRKGSAAFGDGYVFVRHFSTKLARDNPGLAIELSKEFPPKLKGYLYNFTASQWVKDDPNAVFSWLDGLEPNDGYRKNAIAGISAELNRGDPAGVAGEWAASIAQRPDGDNYSRYVLGLWGKSDPQAVYEWASKLEDAGRRDSAYLTLAQTIAATDPRSASEWAIQFSNQASRNTALKSTLSQWATKDSQAAAEWVSGLEDSALRDSNIGTVLKVWRKRQPGEARKWVLASSLSDAMKEQLLK